MPTGEQTEYYDRLYAEVCGSGAFRIAKAQGYWIGRAGMGWKIFTESECSECGKRYNLYPLDYKYCPECGTMMNGKQEMDANANG